MVMGLGYGSSGRFIKNLFLRLLVAVGLRYSVKLLQLN